MPITFSLKQRQTRTSSGPMITLPLKLGVHVDYWSCCLTPRIYEAHSVSFEIWCVWAVVISTFIQTLHTTRAKCMTKGRTFKPRTRSEPKGSVRRRAVHTQKHFIQQQQVRGKEIQKRTQQKQRATPRWKKNQALSSGWFSEPQAGSCLAFQMV